MSFERPKVLVVDDAAVNLAALRALLAPLDCEVLSAASGAEALRLARENVLAAAVLDVQMPEMDGFELARRLRDGAGMGEVPILLVAEVLDPNESWRRAYGAGAFDVLLAPLNPQALLGKIQFCLELDASRRRLRAEVEAHRQTLEEVEAFNYSVSHDLRGPLRPLEGFCDALLEGHADRLDDRGRDYLRRIRAAAQRMGELIDDLRDLSRIGRADVVRRPVDLSGLVAEIGRQVQAEHDHSVELVCAAGVTAQGDARLLRIALENLLRNAWKFTGRAPRAQVVFGRVEGEAQPTYFVRDNGVGFDPGYADRLFQPFQRLHGAEFPGTGIGLAIVQRIVRRHQGRLWAESTPGRGATFYFTLPRGDDAGLRAAPPLAPDLSAGFRSSGPGPQ
jgi:two-component system sensor histidine kinase/response regulator